MATNHNKPQVRVFTISRFGNNGAALNEANKNHYERIKSQQPAKKQCPKSQQNTTNRRHWCLQSVGFGNKTQQNESLHLR